MKLFGYDFKIQYNPEVENKAINALSRLLVDTFALAIIFAGH